jgi:MFS family permease
VNTRRAIVVAAIGTTQTIAWASSYYMPAILGAPIASTLHLPTSVFFGLFSGALLLSAVVGPSVGRMIDRHGGRVILAASNLVIAAGLVILAAAHGVSGLVIAWTVLGLGLGMGLYDPAFAALTWLYGREARSAITGITLIAGFASTVGWPASALFLDEFGWRSACLIWAGLNILLAAPLNWLTIPRRGRPAIQPRVAPKFPLVEPPRGRCRSSPSSSLPPGSSRERWRRICRVCCKRPVRPRPRQSPPRHWSAQPKSALAWSSLGCCAPSTRSPQRGSLPCCTRSAPGFWPYSALPRSSRSPCCMAPATA